MEAYQHFFIDSRKIVSMLLNLDPFLFILTSGDSKN